jgi:hypothetical protein
MMSRRPGEELGAQMANLDTDERRERRRGIPISEEAMKKAMWVNALLVVVLAGSLTMLVGCFGGNPFFDLDGTHWWRQYLTLTQYAQVLPIYNLDLEFGATAPAGQLRPTDTQGNATVNFNLDNPSGTYESFNGIYTQSGNSFTATFPATLPSLAPRESDSVETVLLSGYVVDADTLNVTSMSLSQAVPPGTWIGGSFTMSPATNQ